MGAQQLHPAAGIRPLDTQTLDAAVSLLQAVVAGMRALGIEQWDDVYPNRSVLAADIEAREIFGAFDGPRLLGVIVVNTFQDPEYADVPWQFTQAPIAVIHRVMVDPAAQGRGVARALMQHAERHARTSGFATLRLDAFTQNPRALRLYPALGYRHAGDVLLRKGRFLCFEKSLESRLKRDS